MSMEWRLLWKKYCEGIINRREEIEVKRHIDNPYKVNWKMYGLIGGLATLIMIIAAICSDMTNNLFSDMVKNLAYGCVASTIVALLIEVGNIKEKNENANRIYDEVYFDLKYQIMYYVETWSRLCNIAFKDDNYSQEKHTWIEWYEIVKNKFLKCNGNRQTELFDFFKEQLSISIDEIEKALKRIENQKYLLNINGIFDKNLSRILEDYRFEFYGTRIAFKRDYHTEDFWSWFDGINLDLVNYISNWIDIRYYNFVRFKPSHFFDDSTDIAYAILESERSNK